MKNWKTTLVGVIIAACVAIQPLIAQEGIKWTNIVFAAIIAAFGYFSKDFDQTGV